MAGGPGCRQAERSRQLGGTGRLDGQPVAAAALAADAAGRAGSVTGEAAAAPANLPQGLAGGGALTGGDGLAAYQRHLGDGAAGRCGLEYP